MPNKIVEALSSILPEDTLKEVTSAVDEALNEAKTELEAEYQEKLDEAYEGFAGQLKEAEATATKGYEQAATIIEELRNRLETQRNEFESFQNEQYSIAAKMLEDEQSKSGDLETRLYEEYDKKYAELEENMIDKLDQFLKLKGRTYYEQARRDVLNDPTMAEHKVALDHIVDTVANYISDEEYSLATSKKLEESNKHIEDLSGRLKIVEAKNIRLAMDNQKLNEEVKKSHNLLTEQKTQKVEEKRELREEKAQHVEGKGRKVTNKELIAETVDKPKAEVKEVAAANTTLVEAISPEELKNMRILSGVTKSE